MFYIVLYKFYSIISDWVVSLLLYLQFQLKIMRIFYDCKKTLGIRLTGSSIDVNNNNSMMYEQSFIQLLDESTLTLTVTAIALTHCD